MKSLIRIFLVLLFFGAIIAFIGYQWIFGVNTQHAETQLVYIPSDSEFEDVVGLLDNEGIIKNSASFIRVANWMQYDQNVKPGKYLLAPGLSNRTLISQLRAGEQEPVQLTISTARTVHDIAGIAGAKLESDSLEILNVLTDPDILAKYDVDKNTVIGLFIPNTYEFYWDTKPKEFLRRMHEEYNRFWTKNNRAERRDQLNLTNHEISALASIVEKESIQKQERPTIAGVYLNRIERGIPLQADPTVVFAVGDFTIRRVLNKHLAVDSPYNTYMYPGIPPGPICMPSISSIDAVLNAEKHDYLFFCAKPGYNGSHLFAKTSAEHERNARVYRNWLNSEGIRG